MCVDRVIVKELLAEAAADAELTATCSPKFSELQFKGSFTAELGSLQQAAGVCRCRAAKCTLW